MSEKKAGRPTDNPKQHRITVRLDEETWEALKTCQKELGVSISTVIRDGIVALYQDAGKHGK